MSDGATIEDAITNGLDAMRGWTLAMRAEGHPIPAPTRSQASVSEPSNVGEQTETDLSSLARSHRSKPP
jgi:hypothetical protein